ncbi:MAG: NAD+ synthase [Candidatus Electrothrix aestuarii]|uniref:Glutamine-dependent NAD(+) synthetase n=1 Tax=Candidatus Electrothrix aestuarii TaxID=3062594 RepID=A0AAU8LV23_9BACT|nr:NAD+ synthase [Candidatus Electrothrix aestuarii]
MKIALAQINPIIGAFMYNRDRVVERIRQAEEADCGLIIFPELTLCGYPPQDLLERPAFLQAHDEMLEELVASVGEIGVILGVPEQRQGKGKPLYNSALLIHQGRVLHRVRKQLLPTYDVFDESRYFEPGPPSLPFSFQGLRLGLTICEDIWPSQYPQDPVASLLQGHDGLDLLINISASPYHHGKLAERNGLLTTLCREHKLPLLYVNQVGGQDSLIFDGHSLALNTQGEVYAAASGFAEELVMVELEGLGAPAGKQVLPEDSVAQVEKALVLGLRDYLHKIGFKQAVIGLSGGIDSAVTAVLAALALGPENVLCVALPSPYTAQMSIDDAAALAKNLGCAFELLPIAPAMEAYGLMLAPLFAGREEDVTEQNLQARIRGNLLMALSNKFGSLLLTTGNKSEMAVGYCTLYGDMSGGLAVLADVPKVMVYELARWMNRAGEVIPERIITRPPSAELKPDQADQDDLPPYEVLDPILSAYLEEHLSIEEIVARGFAQATVEDIVRRIRINEHKRKQAPLGLKVTSKAFGYGRRYPIVHGFTG